MRLSRAASVREYLFSLYGVESQTVTLRAVILVPGSVVRTLLAAASSLQVHGGTEFEASGRAEVPGVF